jgi:hypothetical protein
MAKQEPDCDITAGVDDAALITKLQAENAELKEETDCNYRLLSRQNRLLSATVNVLRGDPPDDTLWSVHDVVELAAELKAQNAALRGVLAEYVVAYPAEKQARYVRNWTSEKLEGRAKALLKEKQ